MKILFSSYTLRVKFALAIAVCANGLLWFSLRPHQPTWANVPPAPSYSAALFSALGDPQFSYRLLGLAIQNFGDVGGRIVNLADYDYDTLAQWFMLEHELDPMANFAPHLGGYFFSASRRTESLRPLIDYLEIAGQVDAPQKWRYLVQATFLARHKLKDMDRAFELASILAELERSDMPAFTRQMRAFVLNAKGEKEDALVIMMEILRTQGDKMKPEEINAARAYICEQIFTPNEASGAELCEGL